MNKDILTNLIMELLKTDSSGSEENKSTFEFWKTGQKYFIRTITMHAVGELISVTDKELLLKDASWIADSGRFNNALRTGELEEVEPFVSDVIVNRGAIVDATLWDHALPRDVK